MLGSFPGSIHLENYGRRLSFRRGISIILNGIGKMHNLDPTFEYGKRTVYSQPSKLTHRPPVRPTATNFTIADLHTHYCFHVACHWMLLPDIHILAAISTKVARTRPQSRITSRKYGYYTFYSNRACRYTPKPHSCRITAPPCRKDNEMDATDYRQG